MLYTQIIRTVLIVLIVSFFNCSSSTQKNKSLNPGIYSKIKVLNFSHDLSNINTSSFKHGKSLIYIYSFKRGLEEDPETSTRYFEKIEKSVFDDPNNIKSYFFNMQIKKIVLNNKTWIDSVVVSAFEVSDRRIVRKILSSTDDYFIVVSIIPQEKYESIIFNETPNYFVKNDSGNTIWDYKNNKIELFAKNIVNANLGSKVGNDWYKESSEIISSLKLE